jgi:hypothetical protein
VPVSEDRTITRRRRQGTIALSWGPYGGFYVRWRQRICLGWLALTYCPVELDEMMEAYADRVAPAVDYTSTAIRVEFTRDLSDLGDVDWSANKIDGRGYTRGAADA